jgi:hypothetical protein
MGLFADRKGRERNASSPATRRCEFALHDDKPVRPMNTATCTPVKKEL